MDPFVKQHVVPHPETSDLIKEETFLEDDHQEEHVYIKEEPKEEDDSQATPGESGSGGAFECESCPKTFFSALSLRRHRFTHTTKKTFKCDQCPKTFKYPQNLSGHRNGQHKGKAKFSCEVCGKTFQYESVFRNHLVRHSDERNVKCFVCWSSFKNRNDLCKHVSIVHATEKRFECEACSKRFSTATFLRQHVLSHSKERPFKCDQCPRTYKSQYILANHQDVAHNGNGKFACSVCGKRFVFESGFKRHLAGHSDVKSAVCDECGGRYKNTWILAKHKRNVHSSERPFQCAECLKRFSTKNRLRLHSASHGDAPELKRREYRCGLCGDDFVGEDDILEHVVAVHKRKTFECSTCAQKFTLEDELDDHVQTTHPSKLLDVKQEALDLEVETEPGLEFVDVKTETRDVEGN